MTQASVRTIPIVDYLVLDDGEPHLVAWVCPDCGARYLDHREACASCSGTGPFTRAALPTTGRVGTFTIVHRAAKGVSTPFVSAVVYLDDGAAVRTNLVDCPPTPEAIRLHMPVHLVTFDVGTDAEGTVAIGFGFSPT
jgi:uncharacterized protein